MNDQFKHRKHTISLRTAVSGLILAFKTQPNFKIMIGFALVVILLSRFFNLSLLEWIVIVWTIFVVLIAEMINTAIEAMVDLITTEWREDAKIAKDIGSAVALSAVMGSVIVGLLIFVPKILKMLG